METLIYIGKVSLYLTLFYACYRLFLWKQTFFVLNRFYLLGSLLASFLLPFVIYPEQAPVLPVIYEATAPAMTITATETSNNLFTISELLWAVYISGVIWMSIKLISHIRLLRFFLNQGEKVELEDCNVIIINNNNIGSFSFLKWIVVNINDYENHFDDILRHEMVHMQQKHSMDILLVEAVKIVFWFNPILILYKKSLQEVHEFLADVEASNRETYARFLVSYTLNAPVASLTNHFFKPSQIKSRIQMIYKNRTSKWLLSTYALAIGTISVIALIIAGCESRQPEKEATTEKISKAQVVKESNPDDILKGKKIFTVVEDQPVFPGGIKAMYEFLGDNLKYPAAASRAYVSGRVFLSFVVTETGEIADIQVLKGLGFGCDEEAVRVLKTFPKWTPAKQNGQAVNVRYNLPINFQLKENGPKAKKDFEIEEDASIQLNPTNGDGATRIQIKGDALTGENQPLYVIDGKLQKDGSTLKALDPNNIESVTVLKDKHAIDQYGEAGKNGVIQVTTK